MRVSLQPAFVLHHRSYRETSLIIDLFTQDYGRVAVVARGVRTPKSKLRACLQAFVPLLVSFQGQGELMTLVTAEPHAVPLKLQGSSLFGAFYVNELLMRVLPKQDAHPKLFLFYQQILEALQTDMLQEKTLRLFEKNLLKEMGYELHLEHSIPDNQPFAADKFYYFDPEQGFHTYTGHVIENSHGRIFVGKSLLALAAEKLDEADVMRDVKRLMRMALAPLLGSAPLQSRKLFLEVDVS